jgi:hypothetical protein
VQLIIDDAKELVCGAGIASVEGVEESCDLG